MTQPRTFTLKNIAPASVAYGSACRAPERMAFHLSRSGCPMTARFVPAGEGGEFEMLREGGVEMTDARREWMRHLDAGRIGGA